MTQKQFIKMIAAKVYRYITKSGLDEQAAVLLWDEISDEIGEKMEDYIVKMRDKEEKQLAEVQALGSTWRNK